MGHHLHYTGEPEARRVKIWLPRPLLEQLKRHCDSWHHRGWFYIDAIRQYDLAAARGQVDAYLHIARAGPASKGRQAAYPRRPSRLGRSRPPVPATDKV